MHSRYVHHIKIRLHQSSHGKILFTHARMCSILSLENWYHTNTCRISNIFMTGANCSILHKILNMVTIANYSLIISRPIHGRIHAGVIIYVQCNSNTVTPFVHVITLCKFNISQCGWVRILGVLPVRHNLTPAIVATIHGRYGYTMKGLSNHSSGTYGNFPGKYVI
jgi:hypothetical protein